ncbi:hypothetical protein CCMSSC00406_0002353 [Pleurotus cornucopiae]|uniref:Uncharacterized protein n=1 Tax=Pleurotus cornucopiae TaxID=5321 RepID=A0ACB7J5J6_PLECO|nr:hypothetical protein CCMSSC00406_0002353 [Pleurotus cornucopiae]
MSQSPSQLSAITASTTSHQPSVYHSVPGVILFNTPSTTGSPTHLGSFTGERNTQLTQPGHAFLDRIVRKMRQQIEDQHTAPEEKSHLEKLRHELRAIDITVEVRCYKVYRAAVRRVQRKP